MLLKGDCRQQLATLPDNSVHAIITDPPYELGFMGKTWDSTGIAYNLEVWTQCLRVLKPGGHLLAFGGSRTYHRLACAIEDAGFEIRDQIMWVYGSGFPKSLDVSKAIDKLNGRQFDDRYALGRHIQERRKSLGITTSEVNSWFGYSSGCQHWESQNPHGARVPSIKDFAILKDRLQLSNEFDELVARIEAEREIVGTKDANLLAVAPGQNNDRSQTTLNVTAPSTDAAKQWDGWGTALKPAHEPIVLARKPLNGTVANNVLTHGVGALNINASRVGNDGATTRSTQAPYSESGWRTGHDVVKLDAGRWPANFIHDGSDEVLQLFPDTAAGARPAKANKSTGEHYEGGWGPISDGERVTFQGGSAARFFYCAKASRTERNTGLDHLPEVRHSDRPSDNLPGGDNPRNRTNTPQTNFHPTVKPLALIHYLIKLVTPPGGTILDPFLGSGTTAVAATQLGHPWIGCELTPDYWSIIEARVAHATQLT